MSSSTARPAISTVLPPLIMGTASFNNQYNPDAFSLPTEALVHKALASGLIRGFDTSPYYGPAEILLGEALATCSHARESYQLLTKVGRIASSEFDYSPQWIRKSVARSLRRLHTTWLDVVYCHDVEFVTAAEVLTAIKTLRELRDEGVIKYVGISGYPVDVLADLAVMIQEETGEPLDIVMSYANYTLQNTVLYTMGVDRLKTVAGVDCVLNASPLGMGLLRCQGVPKGGMGDFHPAPTGLRKACLAANDYTMSRGERLETVAVRWALENWALDGAVVGSANLKNSMEVGDAIMDNKIGISVIGVSFLEELDETLSVWSSILAARSGEKEPVRRRQEVQRMAKEVRSILGSWQDYRWASPGEDYLRAVTNKDRTTDDDVQFPALKNRKQRAAMASTTDVALVFPLLQSKL